MLSFHQKFDTFPNLSILKYYVSQTNLQAYLNFEKEKIIEHHTIFFIWLA